ncbi:hypothetical protein DL98DRAFT_637461 [Cadophora sp. DSE1049]|nr:hypothetical protein DL98DRAFT_637461 [Cadophora sp. DSE1049]
MDIIPDFEEKFAQEGPHAKDATFYYMPHRWRFERSQGLNSLLKQGFRQRDRPHAYAGDANDSSVEQPSDTSQRSASLSVWHPSDHTDYNSNTHAQDTRQYEQPSNPAVTSLIPYRLATLQHTSSKRKQDFEDSSILKRLRIELADAAERGFKNSNTRRPTRQTYEVFALRYYMLIPSSLWTIESRDVAQGILTRMLEASKSEALDTYQLGIMEILICADMLAFLENARIRRLDHCATAIQKNLKATYYRRRYLKARDAIIFTQFIIRKHLAWKYVQKIKAATTIQRIWRGKRQRTSLDVVRNNVTLIQAAAKGFLRRREIMNTRTREAAVLIQKMWRLRRHIQSWRRYKRGVIIMQTLWRVKCARRRIRVTEASSDVVSQGDPENDWIAQIPAHWRIQLQRIKSREVLEDCQLFLNKIRHPVTSIDIGPDQNAMERCGGPDEAPTINRRLKQLRFIIEDGWEKEQSLKVPKMVLQILRRVHLAELTTKYMEEVDAEKAEVQAKKAAVNIGRRPLTARDMDEVEADKATPKGGRQPTVKERFVNLLFPHTVKHTRKNTAKGKKSGKGKKGGEGKKGEKGEKSGKGKKGRKGRNQTGEQLSPEEVRAQAEDKFEYWIRLGKPLRKLSQQYGLPFLVVLPKELTESSLYALRNGHDQAVVDYVDFCYPGLKEQISNLSCVLRGILASEIPTKRLVIETIQYHELSDHPFEELFQFSSDRNSSELGETLDAERSC